MYDYSLFQDDYSLFQDDYDNEEIDESIAYFPNTQQPIPANPKASIRHDFAWEIASTLSMKVIAGQTLLCYDQDGGFYRQTKTILPQITRILADNVRKFSYRDLEEIENLIRIYPDFGGTADQFNADPSRINTATGILDWEDQSETPHSSTVMFTYCVDAQFLFTSERNLSAPTFEHFCATSLEGDDTKREFLLEVIGYCLSDCTGAKCAFFLKGAPDSGKSIMLDFISKLLDPTLISSIPLHKLHERFNRAVLCGKKINVSGEIVGKSISEISTFKSITGGDAIEAEFKGQDMFFFTPRCKLIFAGNTLPGTKENDATAAFANRLAVLLFNHSIPKNQQDKQLLSKLIAERNTIFTLSMHALRRLKNRNYQFVYPEDSLVFIQAFAGRHNSLHCFIQDCCELHASYAVHNVTLYAAYVTYCTQNGLDVFSKSKLYEMLSGITGVSSARFRLQDANLHGHRGIRIKQPCQNGTLEQKGESPTGAMDFSVEEMAHQRTESGTCHGTDNEYESEDTNYGDS